MSVSSEESSSDVSSIYQSDDADVIQCYTHTETEEEPTIATVSTRDNRKYGNYTDLKCFKISDTSGIHLFSSQAEQRSAEFHPSIIDRLREISQTSFIYISKALGGDIRIQQRIRIPPAVICDAFVVSPFQPVGIFTFLLQGDDVESNNCLEYNSHIAREVTTSVREDGTRNFSPVHGVFDLVTCDDSNQFVGQLQHLEEMAYLIGMKSCMDLDETTCDSVIQNFVKLLFDFQDLSDATVAMETACRDGNLQLTKDIISVSPETVNVSSEHGDTPLMWASFGGHYDVVKVLLSHKVDVNVKNNRDETALLLTSRKSLLHKALDRGKESSITIFGSIREGDLHIIEEETSRDSEIYTKIVELLLSHGADENVGDSDGFTPLQLACIFGDIKITDSLLSCGVSANYKGVHDSTALMWACVFGHDNIVDRLVQAGADVNIPVNSKTSAVFISDYFGPYTVIAHGANVDEADVREFTPLYYAAMFGFPNVVKQLIAHRAEIDKPVFDGKTPLMAASRSGHSGSAELLIRYGADVNYQGSDETTPLMISAMLGHNDTARLLLSHNAKIDRRDVDGRTALMLACLGGWDDVVELLLSSGADVNVTDNNGDTSLTRVCINAQNIYDFFSFDADYKKVGQCFMDHRNNPRRLESIMNNLKTVCHDILQSLMFGFAHLTGDTDVLTSLQRVFSDQHTDTPAVTPDNGDTRHDRVLKMLLSHGADVNTANNDGDSALLVACTHGYGSGVRVLLEHGADVNIRNKNSDAPLSLASREEHSDSVELLLNHKADVNVRGSDGDTPLIEASREGNDTVIEILLRHGADVNIRNNDGETALTVAEEAVVEILMKHGPDIDLPLQSDDKANADVNVSSNKQASKNKKGKRKGTKKERTSTGLGLLKFKTIVKAHEIMSQHLCKVS